MTVVVSDTPEVTEEVADEPSEIVEATGDAIVEAVATAAMADNAGMPPATMGEFAMSNAILLAATRIEAAAEKICSKADELMAATLVTAEVASEMAATTESMESAAATESEEAQILEPLAEEVEAEQMDVAPGGRRSSFRKAWGAPKRR